MKILRILAVCLLVFALPVQGFAAVSHAFCHTRQSQAVPEVAHGAHFYKHDPSASHSHQVGHADNKVSKLNHKCSHCTQCCAGYAVAFFEQPRFTAVQTRATLVEFLLTLHGSVSLRGLERPPRTSYA